MLDPAQTPLSPSAPINTDANPSTNQPAGDALHDRPETSRIREIPYNYTSFSDREIVIRFLGEENWRRIEQLRGSRRTGRSARMLFEVLGDMWVVSRNPYLQDDLLEDPKRRRLLLESLQHRLEQFELRLNDNAEAAALLSAARDGHRPLRCPARCRSRAAPAPAQTPQRHHPQGQHRLRRACAGLACDRRDRLARRDAVRGHPAGHRGRGRADRRRLHRLRAVADPARRRHRLYRLGGAAVAALGGDQHREARSALGVERISLPGVAEPVPTVRCGAGVVTRRVADLADANGLAFAVDPTSQDASCIGGNVAMNAGGKKAVLWGTAIDNLASWRMVTPDADWLEVERVDHNLGKLQDTDVARFRISRFAPDGTTPKGEPELLEIPTALMRKPGLGKDVTDKALGGLPGVQKEGCDGLITSARFILHRMPEHVRTVCLEFFGTDLNRAVPAIVEIKDFVDARDDVQIAGLEHLDERYVRAVRYSTKAARRELPKMVLVADLVATTRPPSPRSPMRWSSWPRRAMARASSPSAPRRASASGSTAPAPPPSRVTPTPSRSTRTWSSRCRAWPSTAARSSA